MPPFYGPPWGPAGRRRAAASPHLRVSDADRADVADRLSKHYGDGRLDQAEFDERLERAMSAKTQGDLSGLLDDLPPLPAEGAAPPPRTRHFLPRVLVLVLLVGLSAALWHGLFQPFHLFFFPFFVPVPWLLVGLAVFVLLRRGRRGRYGGHGPG